MRTSSRTLQLIFDGLLVLFTAVLAGIAIKQADVTRKNVRRATEAANAAGRAAKAAENANKVATKQLELSERPWVAVTHEITRPLTFVQSGNAVLVLTETMENVGQSAAVDLNSWADLVPIDPDHSLNSALGRQKQYCDAHRKVVTTGGFAGYDLLPKQKRIEVSAMGSTKEQVNRALMPGPPGERKEIGFVVVGCVFYRAFFEPADRPLHQTRFMYFLAKLLGPGATATTFAALDYAGGFLPMVEPIGTPQGLQLIQQAPGNSAD